MAPKLLHQAYNQLQSGGLLHVFGPLESHEEPRAAETLHLQSARGQGSVSNEKQNQIQTTHG